MNRVFVDMDGVIVDFDAFRAKHASSGDEVKRMPGAYLQMEPYPDAIAAVRSIIGMGYEVWIATKPPTGIAFAYADKAAWVMKHLPELTRRIIITHDKGLLGDAGDYLIDDRPHKANCEAFKGQLLKFTEGRGWPHMLSLLSATRPRRKPPHRPGTNTGHGHVWERPDGMKAKCGGPAMCSDCASDRLLDGVEHNGFPEAIR